MNQSNFSPIFRFITSSSLSPYVVNGSVDIIQFDKVYDLSPDFVSSFCCNNVKYIKTSNLQTIQVSDHYPVAITLEGSVISSE